MSQPAVFIHALFMISVRFLLCRVAALSIGRLLTSDGSRPLTPLALSDLRHNIWKAFGATCSPLRTHNMDKHTHERLQSRMETCMTSTNLIRKLAERQENKSGAKARLRAEENLFKELTHCNLLANAFSIFNSPVRDLTNLNECLECLRKLFLG